MYQQHWKETCPACGGTGIQRNKDGLNVNCPVCGGTGRRWRSNMDDLPPGVYCHSNELSTTVSNDVQ